MFSYRKISRLFAVAVTFAALAACGGGGSDDGSIAPVAPDPGNGGAPTNNAPTITGTPPDKVVAGEEFSFTPTAADPDGDSLTFTINNRPNWVTQFNANTGRMAGTPSAADVGTYQQISITVSDGALTASLSPFAVEVENQSPAPAPNEAPSISGNPDNSVLVGDAYAFTPTASDPEGEELSFTISNRPQWLSFDPSTGRVSGTPQAGDAGTYNGVTITVSDGALTDALTFSITVEQVATGSVTLSWDAPTQNTDGSTLTDLTGYALYYGPNAGFYPNRIQIGSTGITSYVIDGLSPGTYYFVAVAVTEGGVESDFSNEVVRSIP